MNRRSCLQALMAASAAFALDPERVLWVPGQKRIFLPPPTVLRDARLGISMRYITECDIVTHRYMAVRPEWLCRVEG